MTNPTPDQIREARHQTGLSQKDAADQVYKCVRAWKAYESGETKMDKGLFELFLIKKGLK